MKRRWWALLGLALLAAIGLCAGLESGSPPKASYREIPAPIATVAPRPTEPSGVVRDGPNVLPSPLTPEQTEARFVAWREDFLHELGELEWYCGGTAEVTCDGAACVVRVDQDKLVSWGRYFRRPQRMVEQFAVHELGMPAVLDRCKVAWDDVHRAGGWWPVKTAGPSCNGFFPRVEQPPPPAEGANMRDGHCVNCDRYDDPGPPHAIALCDQLAGQPLADR